MSVYKEAERLQEALDLLTDVEDRREQILTRVPPEVSRLLSLQKSAVEKIVDGAYEAALTHLFQCMTNFHVTTKKEFGNESEGS